MTKQVNVGTVGHVDHGRRIATTMASILCASSQSVAIDQRWSDKSHPKPRVNKKKRHEVK